MRVLVMGAGVIGVTTAYYLARAGRQVTVIDRRPGVGLETSFANGGQVSVNHATPWAEPLAPLKMLKWLGRADAPLLFRLRADPALWAWSLRFLGNCTAGRARINTERALRLALYSRQSLIELREETGIEYDQSKRGILHIYRDAREFGKARRQTELMTRLGSLRRVLDAEGCVAVESALGASRDKLAGGTYSPDDESGDAYKFTVCLADMCKDQGVEFRYGVTIRRLLADGRRLTGVDTDGGVLAADLYLLALGSYSPLLVKPLGLALPIYPAKGYSLTMPVKDHGKAPEVSLTDDEHKLVFSRLGQNLRVAGTVEFVGYDTSVPEARCRPILKTALELFPDSCDAGAAEFWSGLRPATPDGAPVIGKTPYANLVLNTGHGTLGWTMACGSGRAVADLISCRQPEIDLSGLGLERFG